MKNLENKKTPNSNWTWWDEIKHRTEELSYPIAAITVLIVQVALALTYLLVVMIALAMVVNTFLKLI